MRLNLFSYGFPGHFSLNLFGIKSSQSPEPARLLAGPEDFAIQIPQRASLTKAGNINE